MAATTILWVQEAFDAASETFREVVEIARKWNAAVELVRYTPAEDEGVASETGALPWPTPPTRWPASRRTSRRTPATTADSRPPWTSWPGWAERAADATCAASAGSLVAACCSTVPHSLVVLGNLFLSKGPGGTKLRLTRELQESLGSRMHVPVVTADELRKPYLFGRRDAVRLVGFLAVVVVMYVVVLTHQDAVLRFLAGDWAGGGSSRCTWWPRRCSSSCRWWRTPTGASRAQS